MPQSLRSPHSSSGVVAVARCFAAILSLLPSIAGPAYSAGQGQWSPGRDWRQGGNQHKYAVHMALQPGDGNPYHSRILWFGGEKFGQFLGGQWGWTPGGDGCVVYPTSNFTAISVPLCSLDLFCAAQSLVGDKIAVVGGTSPVTGSFGERKIRLLSAGTGTSSATWSAPGDMDSWRWYPSTVPLRDGRLLALAGSMHRSHKMFGGYRNGSVPSTPTAHLVQRQQPVPDGGWETAMRPFSLSNEWPVPRYGHTMVDCRKDAGISGDLVFGGRDSAHTAHNDLWDLLAHPNHEKADPQFVWWKPQTTGGPPPRRSDHTAIRTPEAARRLVVFGGLDNDEDPLNDVWRLDKTDADWVWAPMEISGSPPPVRYGHSAIYDETQVSSELRKRMIVFGGASSYNAAPIDTSVWELRFDSSDLNAATWHEMTVVDMGSPKPAPRLWHTLSSDTAGVHSLGSVSDARVALMFGGKLGSSSFSDSLWGLWIRNDGTVGWQLRGTGSSGTTPGERARHSAVFDSDADHAAFGRYYVYGGENESGAADSYLYTIDTWDNVSPLDTTWVRWADRGFSLSGHSATLRPHEHEEARISEVFDPTVTSGDPWTSLSNSPMYQNSYPPAFMVPGAGDEKSRVINLNGDTLLTYYLDIPKSGPAGAGWLKWPDGALGFRPMTGVQYRPGQILAAGGYGSGGATGQTITLNTSSLDNAWSSIDPMAARVHHNLVSLPTGQVLVVGGNDHPLDADLNPVRRPQIWTPNGSGGGSWTSMDGADALAIQFTPRTYHSTALLLPDGRVLSAGGETPIAQDSANIYCPPYLFKSNGTDLAARPSITAVTKRITWGQTFDVCVSDISNISSACLIAPGAMTHSVDMNQRFVPITILSATSSPGRLFLQAPASPDSAPPGPYLLFVLGSADGSSVPSVAQWVRISSTPPAPPDPLALTADLITCEAIGPIRWQAPTEATGGARAVEYDIRYSFSPINSGNFGSATPLTAPNPDCGGASETGGTVSGLAPATLVYFAGRSKSAATLWSDLSYLDLGTLSSCGGGGGGWGTSAERARDEGSTEPQPGGGASRALVRDTGGAMRANLRPESRESSAFQPRAEVSTLNAASTMRLVGEFSSGSSLSWRLHYLDLDGDEARLAASARRMVFEESASSGGWETRDSTQVSGGFAGVRLLPGAGRLIFPAGTTVEALESDPLRFAVEEARHSELGEIAVADTGEVALDLAPGDTLDLAFRPAASNGEGEDCVFLIRLPGTVSSTAARRPARSPGPAPPMDAPVTEALPTAFALHSARPNPFSGETTLRFDLPATARVRIELFDVQGRRVARLVDRALEAGRHSAAWNGRMDRGGVAGAGVYLCRMTAGSFVAERRITLLP